MLKIHRVFILLAVTSLLLLPFTGSSAHPLAAPAGFVHAEGQQLIGPDGQPVFLRGFNFAFHNGDTNFMDEPHSYTLQDYKNVRLMGMNMVRFPFFYNILEDDAKPYQYNAAVLDWMDQQFAWARASGVYVMLNLHVAPGQEEGRLWSDPAAQDRTIALWKMLAAHYKDDPNIAGYDLINEPMNVTPEQWTKLAQALVDAIRSVDPNHLIDVEAINGLGTLIEVQDTNVMYDFHFYDPGFFFASGMGGTPTSVHYPDENRVMFSWNEVDWFNRVDSSYLPSGNSDWSYYESTLTSPGSAENLIGNPLMHCQSNQGKTYFGDFKVEEFDQTGKLTRTVVQAVIGNTPIPGYMSDNNQGLFGMSLEASSQAEGKRSMTMEKISKWGEINNTTDLAFAALPGHRYKIGGWMKGTGVSPNAACSFALDWGRYKAGPKLWHFDRAYLEHLITTQASYGVQHNVPMFIGETGPSYFTFIDDFGGLELTYDLLDILLANHLNFAFWGYHGWSLFTDEYHYPDWRDANQPLAKLYKEKMGGK